MTPAELLGLPVGTRLRWEEAQLDGEVVGRSGTGLGSNGPTAT
jgi:hypothetical protein